MIRAASLASIFIVLMAVPFAEAKQARHLRQTPARPTAVTDPNEIAKNKGEKIQRAQEAQSRRWDIEMKSLSKSICRGC